MLLFAHEKDRCLADWIRVAGEREFPLRRIGHSRGQGGPGDGWRNDEEGGTRNGLNLYRGEMPQIVVRAPAQITAVPP